ncbi:bone morphogenetic protein 2-B [Anabrus simplex]|uniref:bone morphogenetic protein 2-B n=1 Tax=Anabrus simplex TaxID=316456 RepID=UPI0035A27095
MGRHPVKPAGVPGPARLPQFLLLLVALLSSLPGINCRSFLNATADVYPVPSEPDELEDTYFEEEEVPQLSTEEIERLKKRILEGLGLKRIPDVTKMNVSQEEYERMYNMYLTSVDENRRQRARRYALEEDHMDGHITAHRFYSFTHADHMSTRAHRSHSTKAVRHRHDASIFLYFPVEIPEARQGQLVEVDHATLRLFVSGLHPDEAARGGNTVEVRVFQIVESDRLLVDQRRIHLAPIDSKWTEFDLTRTTESWVSGDSSNMGIEVECLECARRGITLVTPETRGSNSSVSPVLNILVNVQIGGGRDKRSTAMDSKLDSFRQNRHIECHKPRQRCCRHTMEVIFNDIGFSFIKQPKSFDAGYCRGRCPPRFNPAHHHALLQSLVSKDKGAPRPCCAPSKLETLEILHADDESPEKLKLTEWEKVRVIECACS